MLEYDKRILNRLEEHLGKHRIVQILRKIREPPSKYYVRVNTVLADPEDVVESLIAHGFEVYRDELIEEAIYFKVEGPFEIPKAKLKVIADKFAAESVMLGADLYAPGVKECDKIRRGDRVNILSPSGDIVAYGIVEMDFMDIFRFRKGIAVKVLVSRYRAPKLRYTFEYEQGLIYDQSYPAILTTRILDPEPGDIIVDMCSAPGGKTTHIAQLLNGVGIVYAFDRRERKVRRVEEEIRRMKLKNVIVSVADSRYLHKDFPWLRADKVILDPPCSSIGVRPKLYDRKTYDDIIRLANYQRQFIKVAYNILRRDGYLVYSTCTITLEENEEVIKYALELGMDIEEQSIYAGERGLCVVENYDKLQRFHPDFTDTPGYFIAKLRKL
ncbi:MAG: 16S rRNA methyltransferase [Thermoprotei archaeon]|nr:MAG: 16S rRNA methyltransferase [Thermoprotei archaeon]